MQAARCKPAFAAGINASGEIFQIASFAPPIFKAALLFRTSSNR
jgi:hypothetical protein